VIKGTGRRSQSASKHERQKLMDLLQKENQMNLALKKKPADKER